ncbi:MAG: pilin [Burkholderiales bacterium]
MTLQATMKATGVNASVQGGTINLSTYDGGKVWDCSLTQSTPDGGDILPKFRPAACR